MPARKQSTTKDQTDGVQGQTQGRKETTKTVKMVRDDGKTADVHPDMVNEYRKGGYQTQ